ncbi:MAG: hypothetical protein DI498_13875 [Paracoccus denitrificans]|nr:MAG: hypothetical protein DI498_13875 [Paracoccus denitrificans]PZO82894.1 MAG: hypothetical protein DI633_13875 [Paracoccus denitrificans]
MAILVSAPALSGQPHKPDTVTDLPSGRPRIGRGHRGVVPDFCLKVGTSAGSVVQDMTELEILRTAQFWAPVPLFPTVGELGEQGFIKQKQ